MKKILKVTVFFAILSLLAFSFVTCKHSSDGSNILYENDNTDPDNQQNYEEPTYNNYEYTGTVDEVVNFLKGDLDEYGRIRKLSYQKVAIV